MATPHTALLDPAPGLDGDGAAPRCSCGSRAFSVVFKAPVHVRVVDGRVASVVVATDCHEGPIVAECDQCGRSDVDDEDAGCMDARELADAAAPWSEAIRADQAEPALAG
jgi:hypothetical protein